jgi:hypothetical protein
MLLTEKSISLGILNSLKKSQTGHRDTFRPSKSLKYQSNKKIFKIDAVPGQWRQLKKQKNKMEEAGKAKD